jgi:hypothetical protein
VREPISILKKVVSTFLAAILLASSVASPVLDRDGIATTAHFDAQHEGSCAQHPHNHAICVVLASSPQLAGVMRLPAFSRDTLPADAPPAWLAVAAHADAGLPNARAPPV